MQSERATTRFQALACLLGLALVALISGGGRLIAQHGLPSDRVEVALLYLMAVLFIAVRAGLWPALLTAAAGVAALDFLFVQPLYSFRVDAPQDVLLLVFFSVVATTASRLASQSRAQMLIARRHAETNNELYRFAVRLAETVTLDTAIVTAEKQVEHMLGRAAKVRLDRTEASSANVLTLPLLSGGQTIGQLVITIDPNGRISHAEREVIDMLTELTATAIGRQLLADRLARLGVEQETDRLRSALLSSLAHDLTAPVSALASVLTSLSHGYETFDDAERQELIAEGEHEAAFLQRFSDNLVQMTRLEAGALDVRRELVDIGEVVAGAVARARSVLIPRAVTIDIPAKLPTLRLDPVLVEQALHNLLENAAKYTPPDATVSITATEVGNEIVLTIADTGPGFPADESERIFDKFHRVPAARNHQGTGLGLAICRGFIEAHGGTITATNRVDRSGAIFTIMLPRPGAAAPGSGNA
jgi:two-component system, OmpR family, sensor histidine kinase KdpD